MTLVKLSFLSKKIFEAPLKNFYDLETMIHVACTFAKYHTGAIAVHSFEAMT